jgi:hypothetical protein
LYIAGVPVERGFSDADQDNAVCVVHLREHGASRWLQARAEHAAVLGKVIWVGGKAFRLVLAAEDITAAASKVVSTELSSGVPTWAVDLAGTTGASVSTPAGVVPAGQVGSTGTANLIAGDYFYAQVSGAVKCVSGGTLAAFDGVGATSTAGKVDTTTTQSVFIGVATEAASAADETVDVILRGLI